MIRIRKYPQDGTKRLKLLDVIAFVDECKRAGIAEDTEVGGTVSVLAKIKTLEVEG